MSLDIKDFRRALGQFPTGVTVITTCTPEGEPIGVTASSFNTVSLDPPLILWSLAKQAHSLPVFKAAEYFAVNILAKDQVDMSSRFAGRGADKFSGLTWQKGQGDSPLFENCAAQFECRTWQIYEGGDHVIIVGEVIDYRHDDAIPPLVFSHGSYAVTLQHPSALESVDIASDTSGFLSDYLLYLLRIAFTEYTSKFYPHLREKMGVPPVAWRILTLLADTKDMPLDEIARRVAQPMVEFEETVRWMIERGWLDGAVQDKLILTEAGQALHGELLRFAEEYENDRLRDLSPEQIEALKNGLKAVIAAF